ncbi:hypothetical protein G6F37_012775 [Rhizopus arrhizus]|nr:hypothetical protein G6F38_012918 [Rhizopus arrhizus]KAG1141682.1 hypothetical protein G6F37_012775 [Rhizopus arrhizus]
MHRLFSIPSISVRALNNYGATSPRRENYETLGQFCGSLYDHRQGYLRRKTRTELTSYPRLIARIFKAIDNHDIWMEPFFLRLCLSPSDPALSISMGTIELNLFVEGLLPSYLLSSQLKTAQLRPVLSPQYEQPVFDPPISERQ